MGRNSTTFVVLGTLVIALSAGCSTTPEATVGQDASARDARPAEASQSWEPPSKTGNPESYEVFGKRYYVMNTSQGFKQRGTASWYGSDFHGKKTSSGVPYDMYDMTAAHKALPIPTYVRVTHLENGRSVIVKVNDRGPFVGDRIIDLSYAAATQLGMVKKGTAQVEVVALAPYQYLAGGLAPKPRIASTYQAASPVPAPKANRPSPVSPPVASAINRSSLSAPVRETAIEPPPPLPELKAAKSTSVAAFPVSANLAPAPAPAPALAPASALASAPVSAPASAPYAAGQSGQFFVQVGAFSLRRNAEHLQHQVAAHVPYGVHVHSAPGDLYKVRVGPVQSKTEAQQLVARLADLGISAHAVASR